MYNEPAWMLDRNIKSVFSQNTKYDFEHIVVCDDPFREDFNELQARYPMVKLILSEKNAGTASARNIAIRASKGKYIMTLDTDDMFAPGKIEKQIDFMEKTGVEHTYGGYQEIHGDSFEPMARKVIPPRGTPEGYLKQKVNVCYCGSNCFRRDVFDKIGGFDEIMPFSCAEDMEYWVRIAVNGISQKCIPEVLYYLRVHSNNATAKNVKTGALGISFQYMTNKYPNFFV
jgi:teichuronic acid biosynthesis glycosyltransferase TuaG